VSQLFLNPYIPGAGSSGPFSLQKEMTWKFTINSIRNSGSQMTELKVELSRLHFYTTVVFSHMKN
jgi:hypothetical protein